MRLHLGNLKSREAVQLPVLEGVLVHVIQGEGVVDVAGGDAVLMDAHDQVGLVLQEVVHSLNAHLGSGETVTERGVTAADGVTQVGEAGVDARLSDDLILEVVTVVLAVDLGQTLAADGDDAPLAVDLTGLALSVRKCATPTMNSFVPLT